MNVVVGEDVIARSHEHGGEEMRGKTKQVLHYV